MRIILLTLFTVLSISAIAQSGNESDSLLAPQKISFVPEYFSSIIDLNLPGVKGSYSSDQAKIIFKTFLKENTVVDYIRKHKGGGNNRSNFEIGILKTDKTSFRSYILYDLKNEKIEIIELRIEKN